MADESGNKQVLIADIISNIEKAELLQRKLGARNLACTSMKSYEGVKQHLWLKDVDSLQRVKLSVTLYCEILMDYFDVQSSAAINIK